MDDVLMPKKSYSERIGLGRDAQGIDGSSALNPNDPRLEKTYAEFPLSSLDQLIDSSFQYLKNDDRPKNDDNINFVDIGSGCGRLVFYLALSRKRRQDLFNWHIHGIEISDILHKQALLYLESALEDPFQPLSPTNNDCNSVSLHLGPAEEFSPVLGQADLVFAYSTAFSAKSFSPEISALILDKEWSQLLSQCCKNGCVAITTDRALDPKYGWEMVERMDVENPEVFGSTGYIHILKK